MHKNATPEAAECCSDGVTRVGLCCNSRRPLTSGPSPRCGERSQDRQASLHVLCMPCAGLRPRTQPTAGLPPPSLHRSLHRKRLGAFIAPCPADLPRPRQPGRPGTEIAGAGTDVVDEATSPFHAAACFFVAGPYSGQADVECHVQSGFVR